jgi:hypothetical protein
VEKDKSQKQKKEKEDKKIENRNIENSEKNCEIKKPENKYLITKTPTMMSGF